jgi:hypothetical protein
MQELIEKLQQEHGLSAEQSYGVLNTIKNFIKEKFPMVGGAVDNLFPSGETETKTQTGDTGNTEGPAAKGGSFSDNISEMLPGESGQKAEQFIKDKLSGMFENKNAE